MSTSISFRISVPEPHSHLVKVEMTIGALDGDRLLVRMPVWTPGSYMIREYARHVQELVARGPDGREREALKVDKASWEIDVEGLEQVTISYCVFAHDLTVRTNHVDGSHAFFNCVATCLYPEGRLGEAVSLEVVAPEGWEVFCGLQAERNEGQSVFYLVEDFDELFDTPIEIGPHDYFDFEVDGVFHRFVIWGDHNFEVKALERDVPELVKQNVRMFGEIPYERYVFINHLVPGSYGGLEHRHSSVNIYDALAFDSADRDERGDCGERYTDFLRLLSHEHFHAYHVKRLRPEALGPFDYQRENYTRALWAVEGVTSYFDTYNLMQAQLISPERYLTLLEKRIKQLMSVPGRHLHSLEDSGFDAWIKLYRPDENTRNSSVSYYLKGEVMVWLLDLWIRDKSDGERTMADALCRLWREYYKAHDVGFPPGAGQQAVSAEAGADAQQVFDELIRGTGDPDWAQFLTPLGLKLREERNVRSGWFGFETKKAGAATEVKFVARHSPAEKAGLYAGDELVAIDGWSVKGVKLARLLDKVAPGQSVGFHVIRRGRLVELSATSSEAPAHEYKIERDPEASPRALKLLEGWLGTTTWERK